MKFTIKQQQLSKALQVIGKIVSGRNTLPVLDNVLIETKDQTLQFTTTSLEVTITHNIDAIISQEGRTTIPVKLLQNFTSLLKTDEEIEVTIDDNNTAHLKLSASKSEIKTISADEFPQVPTIKKEKEIFLSSKDLSKFISQVAFASSSDQIRPVLTGVFVSSDSKKLTLAATDSYRVAETRMPLEGTKQDELEIIIPAKYLVEAGRILGENKEDISIILSRHQIIFKGTNTTFIARVVEGKFPSYSQIIPTELKTQAILETEEFSRNLRRAALFTTGGSAIINFTPDGITLSSSSQEGSDDAKISGAVTGDQENKVAININFLLDIVTHVKDSNIIIGVNGPTMPVLIKGEKSEESRYVIMPVNK
jgi:DNA polymerase-3 subunit beta